MDNDPGTVDDVNEFARAVENFHATHLNFKSKIVAETVKIKRDNQKSEKSNIF